MGSDIRTKSSVDEHFLAPGTPLPPMDVGHGLEVRIFDNFPLKNLKVHSYIISTGTPLLKRMSEKIYVSATRDTLTGVCASGSSSGCISPSNLELLLERVFLQTAYRVVALIAENSRVHHADEYVYGDHGWKVSAQEAMKEGWNAILDPDYVHSLETNLDVDLSNLGGSTQAFDVFSELYAQLISSHSHGLWTGLLLDDVDLEPVLHNPNRDSWVRTCHSSVVQAFRVRSHRSSTCTTNGNIAPGMRTTFREGDPLSCSICTTVRGKTADVASASRVYLPYMP